MLFNLHDFQIRKKLFQKQLAVNNDLSVHVTTTHSQIKKLSIYLGMSKIRRIIYRPEKPAQFSDQKKKIKKVVN